MLWNRSGRARLEASRDAEASIQAPLGVAAKPSLALRIGVSLLALVVGILVWRAGALPVRAGGVGWMQTWVLPSAP